MKIGIPKDKTSVFYVDTISRELDFIQAAKKGLIRQKHKIPVASRIILSVGRLEAEKNFHELLRQFATLPKKYTLIIVGRGSLLGELEALARYLDISDRVIFAGAIGRDMIWNYFSDADVFVLLSKAEALGLVFWEAMHAGVPVIGSNADGIVETIGKDGDRGRIWTPDLPSGSFDDMVEFCSSDSPEKKAMVLRAKDYIRKQRENALTFNDLAIFKA
jgi:glycosyltransferase involved in cell wall biosynthesis